MSRIKVDLIMPAYNAHKTIVRTLSSIACQKVNFKYRLTIVDDCSENNYDKILNLFKNKIDINVIRLEKNSGVGIARQVGIDNTDGDYIIFIDSDDIFYDCLSLQKLYDLMDNGKNDYGYGVLVVEDLEGKKYYHIHEECLHSKIISRKIIRTNNIKFNKTRTSEDNSFNHICVSYANNIVSTEEPCYIYSYNNDSLTKGISDEKLTDNMIDYIENMMYSFKYVKNKYEDNIINFYISGLKYAFNEYTNINKRNKSEGERLLNEINKLIKNTSYYEKILANNDQNVYILIQYLKKYVYKKSKKEKKYIKGC